MVGKNKISMARKQISCSIQAYIFPLSVMNVMSILGHQICIQMISVEVRQSTVNSIGYFVYEIYVHGCPISTKFYVLKSPACDIVLENDMISGLNSAINEDRIQIVDKRNSNNFEVGYLKVLKNSVKKIILCCKSVP